jgi:acyl-CoA reductase-like NAD-dependent aldehyde dehydrogenase
VSVEAVDRLVSRSPQNPSDIVVDAPASSGEAVHATVERARAAGAAWFAGGAAARSQALRAAGEALAARAGELEDLVVREVGKPRTEARAEVGRAVSILHYYGQQALDPVGESYPPSTGGLLYTERRPHGVMSPATPSC